MCGVLVRIWRKSCFCVKLTLCFHFMVVVLFVFFPEVFDLQLCLLWHCTKLTDEIVFSRIEV